MGDEEVKSSHRQIAAHKRNLHILEEQAASFGKLYCPPYVSTSIEDTRKEIQELEQKIYGEIQSSSRVGIRIAQNVFVRYMKEQRRLLL